MAARKPPEHIVFAQDVLRTEIIFNQALIDLLIAKQVITEEELVSTIQNIKRDHQKLIRGSDKIVPLKR